MRQFVQQLCSEAAVVRFAASEAAFTLLTVDDVTMKQLHFQNPTSEFTSRSSVAGRLSHIPHIEFVNRTEFPPNGGRLFQVLPA